jgi:Ca-activated chloride channel homolog
MSLNVQTDRTLIRTSGRSTRYVLLSFAAPEAPRSSNREPINVSFVIDRSGSMGGSKIDLAKRAVIEALRMLRSTDRFSVVAYDDHVDIVVPSTLATGEAVRNAIAQVEYLQPRGSTNLSGGWLKGCEELAQHATPGQITRCVLLSDGLANQGIVDRGELARHAGELRARGITTTTIGLGEDFDEVTLEGMSQAGAGHFYYVETAVQIGDCLTGELGETLEIVARDVNVIVKAPSGIDVATLNRFGSGWDDGGRFMVHLGDLASRQEMSIVIRLTFPSGKETETARVTFGLRDARAAIDEADMDLTWTFASHQANDTQRRNVVVDRAVASLYAAQATAEALELNRSSRFDEAIVRLESTARRIAQYAGNDHEIRALIEALRRRHTAYSAPMAARFMKSEHYASSNVMALRDSTGKARRPMGSEAKSEW